MPPEDQQPSLRDSLATAFDAADAGGEPSSGAPEGGSAPPPSEPSREPGATTPPADSSGSSQTPSGAAGDPSAQPTQPPASGPARGPDGKFQKKEGQPAVPDKAPAPPDATSAPAQAPAPAASAPATDAGPRAPQAWRPNVREHWTKLPPEVREEVARREAQIQTTIQENAEARDLAERFVETIQPYEAFIRAENSDPFSAVRFMMDTAVALRTSPPAQRAQVVANIVKQYGIDVALLDAALVGSMPPQDPGIQHVQQLLERELKPIREALGAFGARRQETIAAQEAKAQSEVEAFGQDPANEYFADVQDVMADLLEMATRRNIPMTLKDAYDRACAMDPTISKVIQSRQLQDQARVQQEAANRARRAGSSLPSGGEAPVGGPAPDVSTVRGALEAAMAGLTER